ncbi:phosphate signaling complex protein PhoU [Haloplasma contractile]|uniref:Phosphate-specific transport system accessory protein PhoU n=1 Tax=Haloplasma contractile SSD-17B TaxID=1033810 RepID=F7PSJ9_9MOLU|nr:phosphate signaling complex protein PhoU [Haloplasma contractile]ERJ12609.1 Phosphate-specific transport system accessory protein PhoU [Haloplasma contractile SSD-17B]
MTRQKNLIDSNVNILKNDIKKLTEMTVLQYERIVQSIKENDVKKALQVVKFDEEINSLAEDIDLETVVLIARYQPVATDLRRIMTINKLAYEFERVADYASNIAEYVITGKEMKVDNAVEIIANFEKKFRIIFEMIEMNVKAFLEEDKVLARQAVMLDEDLDRIYIDNFDDLLRKFKHSDDDDEQHMISRALILNKHLERAGDHLTNVSEEILYLIKGKRYTLD